MSRKHYMIPTVGAEPSVAVRFGTQATVYTYKEEGKYVKLSGDSQYSLCAAGDPIEGIVTSIEPAVQDGYTIAGVATHFDMFYATADGLEATAGTGTLAVGDFVVCGTVVAAGTALGASTPAKVCKATNQPGATVTSADNVVGNLNAAIAKVVDSTMNAMFGIRVVSLLTGAGAVGTTVVCQRVSR